VGAPPKGGKRKNRAFSCQIESSVRPFFEGVFFRREMVFAGKTTTALEKNR